MIIPVYNAKKKQNSKMIIKNVITKLFLDLSRLRVAQFSSTGRGYTAVIFM